MNNIKPKYFERIYRGEKVPRKIKKAILGLKLSKTELKKMIENTNIIEYSPYNNSYKYKYPDKYFCPYCGCVLTDCTGNMAEYPEEYIISYCLRCGEKISVSDNGYEWHAIMDFKEGLNE